MANSKFSKTDVQQVKRQNQQSASGQGQFGTEFASETDARRLESKTNLLNKTNSKTANH